MTTLARLSDEDKSITLSTRIDAQPGATAEVMFALVSSVAQTVETGQRDGTAVAHYNATPTPLSAKDYPILAALWDNEDDAIFDTL